eukprot:jgi/Bigna1/127983/aug1.5_g2691
MKAAQKKKTAMAVVKGPAEEFRLAVQKRLREAGLDIKLRRSEWPKAVLKAALSDLIAGTPSDLIEREVWLSSSSLMDSWRRRMRFTSSLAVMSVMGWLVGLGDRHLNNILLCQRTAEIVHIDYGVIFDKVGERGGRLTCEERLAVCV